MSTQDSITAVDAEAAELDATRAVYDMLKPLKCEAQTRVLDHVYCLLRQARAAPNPRAFLKVEDSYETTLGDPRSTRA